MSQMLRAMNQITCRFVLNLAVLVKISEAECVESYDYNEWGFDDGTGIVRVEDKIYFLQPEMGKYMMCVE